MRASSSLIRELGSSTRSCSALLALRIRVSMSAIGSVSTSGSLLPRALRHARDRALVGELPQADAAEPELAVDRAGASTTPAARVLAHREARRAGGLRDQRLLGHYWFPPSADANGRPSPRRSAWACSSVTAVVVIVTSR